MRGRPWGRPRLPRRLGATRSARITPPGKRGAANAGRRGPSRARGHRAGGGDSPAFQARRLPLTRDDGRCVLAGAVRAVPDLPDGGAAGPDPDDAQAFLQLGPVGDRQEAHSEAAPGTPCPMLLGTRSLNRTGPPGGGGGGGGGSACLTEAGRTSAAASQPSVLCRRRPRLWQSSQGLGMARDPQRRWHEQRDAVRGDDFAFVFF